LLSALLGALSGALPAMALPLLGSAQNFATLAASALTNTGASTVWGDIGIDPGTSITGVGSLTVTGTIHQTDGAALQAQLDASAAWTGLAARTATGNLTGQDLGGLTLTPGVYVFTSAAQLTGALILDAGADPNAQFVFQIGSALTTASGSTVTVQNGGNNVGVFWQIGSSATLGTGSQFAGNLLADQSITLNTAASILCGRAFALHAALTMDNNRLSNDCAGAGSLGSGRGDGGSLGFSAARPVPEPTPGTLFALGLVAFVASGSVRRGSGVHSSRGGCSRNARHSVRS
jgi:type VI secretion system secreted protein VgrG